MPIYEYKCDSCDHQFEKLMRIRAATVRGLWRDRQKIGQRLWLHLEGRRLVQGPLRAEGWLHVGWHLRRGRGILGHGFQ